MSDAFRINIRNAHIAFLEKDDSTGATHATPIHVPGLMQIQLTPRVKSANLYGDGVVRNKVNLMDGYDITFDHNKIPPLLLAKMRGQEYGRGNASDTPVNFGLAWETEQTEGYRELTWLPKCVCAPSNKNTQQATDSVNYSTDSLAITSIPLNYNRDFEYIYDSSVEYADGETAPFTDEEIDAWFTTVPVKPPQGTTPTP